MEMKRIKRIGILFMVLGLTLLMGCPNPTTDNNDTDTGDNDSGDEETVIDIAAIPGVTPPAAGETPVARITETAQYTGSVSWSPDENPFGPSTEYTAAISLTAKSGYTLTGVTENFFSVDGADSVSNDVNSGEITAVFPKTNDAAYSIEYIVYDENGGDGAGTYRAEQTGVSHDPAQKMLDGTGLFLPTSLESAIESNAATDTDEDGTSDLEEVLSNYQALTETEKAEVNSNPSGYQPFETSDESQDQYTQLIRITRES